MKKGKENLSDKAKACFEAIDKLFDTFNFAYMQGELELMYLGFTQSKLAAEQGSISNSETAHFFIELSKFLNKLDKNYKRFDNSLFKEMQQLNLFLASSGLIDQYILFKINQRKSLTTGNDTTQKVISTNFYFHAN